MTNSKAWAAITLLICGLLGSSLFEPFVAATGVAIQTHSLQEAVHAAVDGFVLALCIWGIIWALRRIKAW
jgi:hypothetical protein